VVVLPVAPPEPATTIVPVYVPGLRLPGVALTSSDDGVVPEAGVTESHSLPEVTLAVKPRFEPVPVTLICCAAGFGFPAMYEKVRAVGVAETAVGGETVRETVTCTVWPPLGVMKIWPEKAPFVNPAAFTFTVILEGVVALGGLTLSQPLDWVETVNPTAPAALDTAMDWAGGLVPVLVEKLRLLLSTVTLPLGPEGTVKVTPTVWVMPLETKLMLQLFCEPELRPEELTVTEMFCGVDSAPDGEMDSQGQFDGVDAVNEVAEAALTDRVWVPATVNASDEELKVRLPLPPPPEVPPFT